MRLTNFPGVHFRAQRLVRLARMDVNYLANTASAQGVVENDVAVVL